MMTGHTWHTRHTRRPRQSRSDPSIRMVCADGRERGSRDLRMMPLACAAWVGALSAPRILDASTAPTEMPYVVFATIVVVVVLLVTMLVARVLFDTVLFTRCAAARRRSTVGKSHAAYVGGASAPLRRCLPMLLLMFVAGGVAALSAIADETVSRGDAASVAASERTGRVEIVAEVLSPAVSCTFRGSDCMMSMRIRSLRSAGSATPSSAEATLFASGPGCMLQSGAVYRLTGKLSHSSYSKELWFTLAVDDRAPAPRLVVQAPGWKRAITLMQRRFLAVTARLGEQGRVLVPGLTLGVLGQEAIDGGGAMPGAAIVDPAYAEGIKEDFRRSGIIHLMVVSGGHFLLLESAVISMARTLRMHRVLIACATAIASLALGLCVYPSAAVDRALAMSLLGACSLMLGRPRQTISQLSWAVIVMLLLHPRLAHSYGFALSCAAVLGIALWSGPTAKMLHAMLPAPIAKALAVTISAQLLTLPIQLLIDPKLPLLSVPANLLVTPVVSAATVCGLLSLALAWCAPQLSYHLAWLASCGTSLMEDCATWIGNSPYAMLPWVQGWVGALSVFLMEMLLLVACSVARRMRGGGDDPGADGVPYQPRQLDALRFWWRESKEMFGLGGD